MKLFGTAPIGGREEIPSYPLAMSAPMLSGLPTLGSQMAHCKTTCGAKPTLGLESIESWCAHNATVFGEKLHETTHL
jgi:hypothetical protein